MKYHQYTQELTNFPSSESSYSGTKSSRDSRKFVDSEKDSKTNNVDILSALPG